MAVSAAPDSQAAALLAHAGPDVLTQLITEATEGDGYVEIAPTPCRLTLP